MKTTQLLYQTYANNQTHIHFLEELIVQDCHLSGQVNRLEVQNRELASEETKNDIKMSVILYMNECIYACTCVCMSGSV